MERVSNRSNNENNDLSHLPPPPPYATVIYKLDENGFDTNPPPAYTDADGQSVIYINNYPGPPLTDGIVQVGQGTTSINPNVIISKKIRIYLLIKGLITILLGMIAFGLEIAIIASNLIIYYYYGFWGGAVLITLGISSLLLYKHRSTTDYSKLFRSFFCQMMLVAALLAIGIVIVVTDKCDDDATENDGSDSTCRPTHKILNGFLIGIFALELVLSIIDTIIFGILSKRHSMNRNSLSQ